MDSLPSISGGMGAVASSGGPHDFNRRLKETQALLARFAEENNRLAKENDKLRTTRMVRRAWSKAHAGCTPPAPCEPRWFLY